MDRFAPPLLLIAGLAGLLPASPAGAASPRERQAERLVASARLHLSKETFDDRRTAIRKLEDATLLSPEHPDWDLLLARTYMRAGYMGLARTRFDKIRQYAPEDAEARLGLAVAWRYDWLKYLESSSRDQAIEQFRAAARLAPKSPDPWIMAVPMLIERNEIAAAAEAAAAAIGADPRRADAMIAEAYACYLVGRMPRADSLFRVGIPRLPKAIRTRFEDIRPVASPRDTMLLRRLWPQEAAAFTRRFWRQQDPDFASAENEAQLEYWSRVTHAYLLYYDARRQAWDERGEIYVRYGPPGRQIYNEVGENLTLRLTPGSAFPMNVLAWEYPQLGMRVEMQDRMLSGFYLPELSVGLIHSEIVEPQPDPDSLSRHPDLLPTGGGRGIFRKVPPGTQILPVEGAIARFEGEAGPRLLSGFEVPGGPGDSLHATWVVRDSEHVEVARVTRALSPSACDPTEFQVADFASELTPGAYEVGVTVTGAGRRRGIYRASLDLPALGTGLTVSDLVIACGLPDADFLDADHPSVRVDPNPAARVRVGEPLTAYFEIGRLRAGADGLARFELNYNVRSIERDPRIWIQRLLAPRPVPVPIRTSRSEEQLGSLRRQFVRVPLQSMPPGRYRLEVVVRDLVSGEQRATRADFQLEPAADATGDARGEGGPAKALAAR